MPYPTARVRTVSDPDRPLPMTPLVPLGPLDAVVAEIESHLAVAGWDQPPALFALVPTKTVAADPEGARLLGLAPGDDIPADAMTPIAQDALPDTPLDEALGGIEWPESVGGCAVSQEILILPPGAEDDLSETETVADAAAHPERREARLGGCCHPRRPDVLGVAHPFAVPESARRHRLRRRPGSEPCPGPARDFSE